MFRHMWSLAFKLIPIVLGWFGFGSKDERDVAHDAGLAEGIAKQKAADQAEVIKQDEGVMDAQRKMEQVPHPDDDAVIDRLRQGSV